MATSYYSTGTISLTNGSAVVTGVGTAWQTALIEGGNIFPVAAGMPLPIASVDSNTQITAEFEWVGETGTYEYRIQRNTAYLKTLDRNSENVAYLLDEMRKGTLFKYDASGTLADRALFDGRPKNFSYLVLQGENAQLWVKASNTSGDWAGPFAYGAGPQGIPGPAGYANPRGNYDAGTGYFRNDTVLYNGSSFVALQNNFGIAPPSLPQTSNSYWQLTALKGLDGTGTGDVVGPVSSIDSRLAAFNGTTGKLLKQSDIVVSSFAKTLLDDASGSDVYTTLGAQQTLAPAGYFKLPSGLIVQWRSVTVANGFGNITWPIAFPTACIAAMGSVSEASAATSAFAVDVSSRTITGAYLTCHSLQNGGSVALSSPQITVLGVGY